MRIRLEESLPPGLADTKMNAITWPEAFVPGTTDNFASNEIIFSGLSAADVWPLLNTPSRWPTYYHNSSHVTIHDGKGPELAEGMRFRFTTFGFPIECECTEYVPPSRGLPARLAWYGWRDQLGRRAIDVHHAWLIEDLAGGRVRVLTQESQTGEGAKIMASMKPNPLVAGHQDWIESLVGAGRKEKEEGE